MHIEILTEDSSGQRLVEHLMPKLIGRFGEPHSWRSHAYRGIGRIPKGLSRSADPLRRMLLDQMPRLLRGYVKTPGVDAVVVVLDTDVRDCRTFLAELQSLSASCDASHLALFRLAIEETEAWYLGDRAALQRAYPKARMRTLDHYVQDSICGTWELVAEAIHQGGARAVRQAGWPLPGQIKHEWADRIGPLLDPETNRSPSFARFRDGLRRLTGAPSPNSRLA
ncbi:hypothetical protein [Rhodopila sp.]|uniref:hypothetical protein n=1 Tax=Rhodopila sp. TaxID=2480087 RepID=UPI003D0D31A7